MKRNLFYILAFITSLACMQPIAAFAQAPSGTPNPKGKGGPPPHSAPQIPHKAPPVAPHVNPNTTQFHKQAPAVVPHTNTNTTQFRKTNTPPPNVPHNTGNTTNKNTFQKTNTKTVNTTVNKTTVNQVQGGNNGHNHGRSGPAPQAHFAAPQGNRANHYGGQWIAGNTHSDWGNSGTHYWNNHYYRWFDGGWLIFDPGYGYPGGTIVGAVQQQLTADGYYNGPVDGIAGPGTSQAIANYQGQNGLRVTGRINHHLIDSLGLYQ